MTEILLLFNASTYDLNIVRKRIINTVNLFNYPCRIIKPMILHINRKDLN